MYNANKPNADELPSSRQLLRSTAIAAAAAGAILVTVVLPAEYAIDPTGAGRLLGLTEMGEIKSDLADEAERDRLKDAGRTSSLLDTILGAVVGTAHAQTTEAATGREARWKDTFSFTLTPGEGIEYKLVMDEGAVARFDWSAENGRVNYDLHGDGSGESISYEKGRGTTGEAGEITAAFTGNHGWYWRNRDKQDVTVTVRVAGDYSEVKRTD